MNVAPFTHEKDFLSNLKECASIKPDEGSTVSVLSLEVAQDR
jgi:hypothetical protein